MQNDLSLTFERSLYRAVIRFKEEHPGVLEERTKQRKEHHEHQTDSHQMPQLWPADLPG